MKVIRSLYLSSRLFIAVAVTVTAFVLSFIGGGLIFLPKTLLFIGLSITVTDLILLFRTRKGLHGYRSTPAILSNGDENEIKIHLENFYPFNVILNVVDEIPHQFQRRDLSIRLTMGPGGNKIVTYSLRPVKRGEYSFGSVNVYVRSPIGFLSRRFQFSGEKLVPVYPSYIQMRKYELMAISDRLMEAGIKRIRRIGQNMEFELIKEYVSGDDYRTINWKATARKSHLMVNHYQDERSQQVYSLIDKGRLMQMPFNGLSLLDYTINACLVISNIAIKKSDKAGLLTFQDKIGSVLPAGKMNSQMSRIMEVLYNQKTAYRETDFSVVHNYVRKKITHRSLLLLFTNFESIYGLQRQLPYLKSLAQQHLLVVIFFENTEMRSFLAEPAQGLKEIYYKGIAEKYMYDKKLIVKELARHGIQALLTSPDQLTVNTINKYLELKSRGML